MLKLLLSQLHGSVIQICRKLILNVACRNLFLVVYFSQTFNGEHIKFVYCFKFGNRRGIQSQRWWKLFILVIRKSLKWFQMDEPITCFWFYFSQRLSHRFVLGDQIWSRVVVEINTKHDSRFTIFLYKNICTKTSLNLLVDFVYTHMWKFRRRLFIYAINIFRGLYEN